MSTVIFGHGPVGKAVSEALCKAGRDVVVAQRSEPSRLPPGARFRRCDVLDADAVRAAAEGADQIVVAIGFQYTGKVWRRDWPRAMNHLLAASESARARMVFIDNLYMYGPQTEPLREDMPLTSYGEKPAARAEVTRLWRAAHDAGRVKVAALRAPDFYGPGVALSHIGDAGFGALARDRRAVLIAPPDTPHDFCYVPDFARAAVTLLEAPDDVCGQAWHVPCAPIRTPRQILSLGAAAIGVKPRISALPLWALPVVGLGVPMLREMSEMRFQWDRPYRVDTSKFSRRFWGDATPFEIGAPATASSFKEGAQKSP